MEKADVVHFVRHTLGCACPDEVFQHITINRMSPKAGLAVDGSLEVGGRLLIYVTFSQDIRLLKGDLGTIIQAGKRHRDEKGFNRFRLVILTDAPAVQEAQKELTGLFNDLAFIDERVHLHFVADMGIKALLRP
jgi:hypothetical protein